VRASGPDACHTGRVSEPETLTVYLQTEGDASAVADRFRAAAVELPEVETADVEVEDVERSVADVFETITVTLTAAGGVVGAGNLLLGSVTDLIKTINGIRAAWRDAEDGPVPIDVADANANPATPDGTDR